MKIHLKLTFSCAISQSEITLTKYSKAFLTGSSQMKNFFTLDIDELKPQNGIIH